MRACLELGPLGQRRSFSCCQANTLTTIWTLDSTWQAPNQPEMMRRTAKFFADQRSICTICGPSLRQWSVTLPGMLLPAWLDLRPELPKPSNSFITAARDHLKFERFKTSNTTLSHTTVSHTHKSVTQLFHMQFGHTHTTFVPHNLSSTISFLFPASPIPCSHLLLKEVDMWGYPVLCFARHGES